MKKHKYKISVIITIIFFLILSVFLIAYPDKNMTYFEAKKIADENIQDILSNPILCDAHAIGNITVGEGKYSSWRFSYINNYSTHWGYTFVTVSSDGIGTYNSPGAAFLLSTPSTLDVLIDSDQAYQIGIQNDTIIKFIEEHDAKLYSFTLGNQENNSFFILNYTWKITWHYEIPGDLTEHVTRIHINATTGDITSVSEWIE